MSSIRKAAASPGSSHRSPSGRRWRHSAEAETLRPGGAVRRGARPELKAIGITLDFAPVSTSTPIPKNPVSAIARWPRRPGTSRGWAPRSYETLQAEGIAACGKHFPGHGDTSSDSHLELPLVEHPPDRLRAVEFVPFRAAIEAGVATIMTAHVLVPALDDKRPATLSRRIVHRDPAGGAELRRRHPQRRPRDEGGRHRVRGAVGGRARVQAGCDGVLICSGDHDTQAAALEAIVHAVEDRAPPYVARRRCADAAAAGEGAVSCRRRSRASAARRVLRRRARPRRAPRDRRRDGALPVMRKAARADPGRSARDGRSRQPVRARGVRPRRRRDPDASDSSRSMTSRCLRDRLATSPARRSARGGDHAAWSDPAIAGADRRSRRLRQRAGAAAARSRPGQRAGKPFIGYSDLTALLTFLTIAATWWRFMGRCSPAGSVAAPRLRCRFVRACAVPASSRWAS